MSAPTVSMVSDYPITTEQLRVDLNALQPGLGDLIRSPEQMVAETNAAIEQLARATEQALAAQKQSVEVARQAATRVATGAIAEQFVAEMNARNLVWDEERAVGRYIKTSRNALTGIQVGFWIGAATVVIASVATSLAARRFSRAKR